MVAREEALEAARLGFHGLWPPENAPQNPPSRLHLGLPPDSKGKARG